MKLIPSVIASLLVITLFRFLPSAPSTALAAAATPTPASSTTTAQSCDHARSIQVSGTAVVNVLPDRALIQLGVQSNGTTPQAVEEINTTATQDVIMAIETLGIERKDITTDLYIIEPLYDDYDSLYIKGYRINNIIAITLRDVSKTSRVIAAALQAGANQVVNVDLYTSELRKFRDQARDMAMTAAREKAQALALSAGAEAGCVLSINENSWSSYNGWWWGAQNQNQWTQNAMQNVAPSGAPATSGGDEPISLGMISVRAEISATFALK